ncbi:MAG: hypothetical protein ABJA98_21175 [Acidobacteriota bacterium]
MKITFAYNAPVQFRLLLEGHVSSRQRGSSTERHKLRQFLHPQLKKLCHEHPSLKSWSVVPPGGVGSKIERIANEHKFGAYRFVPVIRKKAAENIVSLDFLILRPTAGRGVFDGRGDLDGRIKSIIDVLRKPSQPDEVKSSPAEGEDPFFVVLEDDSQIYEFSVSTDTLWRRDPDVANANGINELFAVINVKAKSVDSD